MILPFPEWKPDLMNTNGQSSQLVQNVVPRADGYGPFGSFLAFSGPLAEGNDGFTKVLLHFDGPNGSPTFTDNAAEHFTCLDRSWRGADQHSRLRLWRRLRVFHRRNELGEDAGRFRFHARLRRLGD